MALPTNAVRSYGGGCPPTTLSVDNTTTITVASTSGWVETGTSNPLGTSGPFVIAVNFGESAEEKILIAQGGISGNTLTVWTDGSITGRGYDGTTASTAAAGAVVVPVFSSVEAREANLAVSETVGTITTAGDTLYAAGAANFNRLGIGTAGQVLTVNSGATAPQWSTPRWITTNPTVRIVKTTTQSIASASSYVSVTSFDSSEDFNIGSFTYSASSGSVTVPTGLGGKYLVTGVARFAALTAAANRVGVALLISGSLYTNSAPRNEIPGVTSNLISPNFSGVVTLAAGAVVTLGVVQNSGVAVNITEANLSLTLVSN